VTNTPLYHESGGALLELELAVIQLDREIDWAWNHLAIWKEKITYPMLSVRPRGVTGSNTNREETRNGTPMGNWLHGTKAELAQTRESRTARPRD
jgi:hypothetical protein